MGLMDFYLFSHNTFLGKCAYLRKIVVVLYDYFTGYWILLEYYKSPNPAADLFLTKKSFMCKNK